ncbi:carboxypeptidase-like regulatory domain-containing protein [Marivirga harenae]|uniref:carboxypeptidase-like regulatory domain-containing protein n=1 Tax=Marivirga harenae TaxID=2010992 RepID=UPI0026DEC176|nr:carboxypeptidase-like regulatory domain-containing protein [Marivirga harenae]WKV13887.1 carboxypeptidase-like regulatory domain-containing protein [Marivirga harenae]
MKNLLYSICLFFFFSSASAQIRISGKIEADGESLPGAHIWKKTNYTINDVADINGFFNLIGLEDGDTIVCSFIGYKEKWFVVKKSDDSLLINMEQYSQQLQSVEVRASVLGAENFAFEKLNPIDIYINPNSKADALVAINTQMSSTIKDENAAVAFRGASPQQTGYFLNGVPVKNPVKYAQLTNTGTLSIFNTDFLKSATVFPGNPPVEYGQATSGTVVLELADRFPEYWQHTASLSMANLGYSSRGAIGEQSFLGVFCNYQFDEVLKGVNSVNFKDINSFNAVEGGALFTTHQPWGSIKIYQYAIIDNYNFNFKHPSYQDGFLQYAERSLTTVQWVQDFGSWQSSLIAGNSMSKNEFQFGNMDYLVKNSDPYTSVNLTYSKKGDVLKTGYAYWRQNSVFSGDVPTFAYALAPIHPILTISSNKQLESHEYYFYGRKKWGDHAFGSGMRTAYIPNSSEQLWSYQFNYLWDINKRLNLIGAHGKYYQSRIDTNPQILEQVQSSIDLDFSDKHWAIHQSFFRIHGDSAVSGSESRLSFFVKKKFQLDQSASFYHLDSSWDWFARTFLKYNPFPQWTFNASFQIFKGNTYRLVNSADYFSDLEVYVPQTRTSPIFFDPYMNFTLGVSRLFQFSQKFNGLFFINVANVFDFKNENSISYNYDYSNYQSNYLTRRSIYAGIIFNFVND